MRSRRLEEDEDDDMDLDSSHKEEKSTSQKANPLRSKHSEAEQRRRLKINERFQVLMDLIPQNDQKRDKASFLLEVIQYIQFLQAKLDMYEGSSQEPSKLVPQPTESIADQPQLISNGSGQEDNYVATPSMLINSQYSVDSEIGEAVAYELFDHSTGSANQTLNQPCQDSRLESQFLLSRPCTNESDLLSYTLNEEVRRIECGEVCISNAYSQGLLNNLTQALQSSGVDLKQACISVQLDVCKRGDNELPSTASSAKDNENGSQGNQTRPAHDARSGFEPSDRAEKRPKA